MKRVIAVMVLFVFIGCSGNFTKDSGIGLKVVKDSAIITGTKAKRLCEQELLSNEDCVKIERLYTQTRSILINAHDIWNNMIEKDSLTRIDEYENEINQALIIMAEIEEIIRSEE